MKKISLAAGLLIIGVLVSRTLFNFSEDPVANLTRELDEAASKSLTPPDIKAKVTGIRHEILEKVVPKKHQNSKAFTDLVDPSKRADLYLKSAKEALESVEGGAPTFFKETFAPIKECALEGCGEQPDADGFYDDSKTVAMITTKRLLEVALLDPEASGAKEWLSKEDLIDMLNWPNEAVREASMKNLFNLYKGEPGLFKEVLKANEDLSGDQTASVIEGLIPHLDQGNHGDFVDAINFIAQNKDAYTILEVLDKTDNEQVQLGAREVERLGQELCQYATSDDHVENFKAMNYHIGSMAKRAGTSLSLERICR